MLLTPPALVLDGVTVVDVEQGRLLPAQRVVIVGNRIHRMGTVRSVKVPAGADVVDARGKYLIPGLWDMHTHSDSLTRVFYPFFIANGVTGIRDASSGEPLDTLRRWRREILAGTRIGPPRQLFVGAALDEVTPCATRRIQRKHLCVADPADARHVVDSLKAAGADLIKMYNLSERLYFAIAAEARRMNLPFGGHLAPYFLQHQGLGNHIDDGETSAVTASDSGASIIDHIGSSGDLMEYCVVQAASVGQCQAVADRFIHNETWWCPTMLTESSYENDGSYFPNGYAILGDREDQLATRAILARFHAVVNALQSGVIPQGNWLRDSAAATLPPDTSGVLHLVRQVHLPMLAGTDVGTEHLSIMMPGMSLHAEIAMYVMEGLSPLEALQTATLNPARFLHATDSLGTVAPGKLADLVLLDADPLTDITNTTAIRAVIANGRYFDRTALDHLVVSAQTEYQH